jgi:hypothetical protein
MVFFISLTLFGAMVTIANIQAYLGLSFMSPSKIMFIFFGIFLILVEARDIIDTRIAKNHLNGASVIGYAWRNRTTMAK